MIINLFSIFDPSSSINFELNWIRILIPLMIIPFLFWIISSRYSIFWNLLINSILIELKPLLINKINFLNFLIFIPLFSLIILINLLGLFPYIFTSSRHLIFSLSLSLSLWISFILFGWINYSFKIFYHIVPQNTPPILIPFIIIIESIRNIIRPLTLAIRLTANIIAGHLLITLIRQSTESLLNLIILIPLILQITLLILELSVSFIQAYVFTILRTLYSKETN